MVGWKGPGDDYRSSICDDMQIHESKLEENTSTPSKTPDEHPTAPSPRHQTRIVVEDELLT